MRIQRSTSTILRVKELEGLANLIDRNDNYLEHLTESLIKGLLNPGIYRRTPFTDSIRITMKITQSNLIRERGR